MEKILIVEDDIYINKMLYDLLRQNKYDPVAAYSGTEALLLIPHENFSLVLLDLMLPGKTGEQVLAELRKHSNSSVIVLTAVTDKETTVKILRMGADDYLTKPFDNNELLARMDARLRRNTQGSKLKTLHHKNITLDLDAYDAVCGNNHTQLSKREFDIFKLLMSYPEKVFTKDNLYESVWGGEFLGDDNILKINQKYHYLNRKN